MALGTATRATAASLPNSLWAATAAPGPETPPLTAEVAADLCIVGGGFTGLSAALHAAQAGARAVVLEAAEPGWGASGRNGGQVIPGLKLEPDEIEARFGPELGGRMIAAAGAAPDLVFELIERHGIDCAARRTGWIQAAHAASGLRLVEDRVAQWSRRGAAVEPLDRAAVAELTGAAGYVGGLLDRRGGNIQPLSYARGLARAALDAGAAVHGGSPAIAVVKSTKGWRVVTPEGAVESEQLLLCTNGYSDRLWPGLARSVLPLQSYQAATRPLSDNLRRSILPGGQACSDTRRLLAYFRLDAEGRLVVGGRGRAEESDDPADYRHVTESLARLFPQVAAPEWQYFWGGRVALTADHLPHLHEPAPGVLAGLGYNGRGVALATLMGKLLAARAAGTPTGDLPFPVTGIRPLRWHGLRRPMIALTVAWKRMLDGWETWQR